MRQLADLEKSNEALAFMGERLKKALFKQRALNSWLCRRHIMKCEFYSHRQICEKEKSDKRSKAAKSKPLLLHPIVGLVESQYIMHSCNMTVQLLNEGQRQTLGRSPTTPSPLASCHTFAPTTFAFLFIFPTPPVTTIVSSSSFTPGIRPGKVSSLEESALDYDLNAKWAVYGLARQMYASKIQGREALAMEKELALDEKPVGVAGQGEECEAHEAEEVVKAGGTRGLDDAVGVGEEGNEKSDEPVPSLRPGNLSLSFVV
ncbi:hypothetical protein L198_02878 [Cryptococcus wingfieldii CBS 7118]|uniref:Uncharacterized protein n=1 Tax=Cryptococcus wingfieldii CBS 7118 TaxID=1295528 RepID=A0A1E3JI37_9TREE|nr:hypothetical protein L198_02878 [Cryptococcus wingfieldii CBS 7118]ODO00559.1 hypothetical protein L198_02878 [Cryptococcus wingfieldii CBS 7118]